MIFMWQHYGTHVLMYNRTCKASAARFSVLARYFGLKREGGGNIRSQGLNSLSDVKRTGTVLYTYHINRTVPYEYNLRFFKITW